MPQTVYTTGYTGKDINDLKPLLERLDAILVDIRFAPFSRILHWRKVYLKALLGTRYRHIANLGNRTFREGKITIHNMALGLETVLSLNQNTLLICACKGPEDCHRRLIVAELQQLHIKTEELSSWGAIDQPVSAELV